MNQIVNQTIRPSEVEHFNQLADTWWDESGPMWPLHRLNNLRQPFIIRHIKGLLDVPSLVGVRVLDIGCGAGLLSEAMASRGAIVTGIDVAAKNIDAARTHARLEGLTIDYHLGALEQLTLGDDFDVVLNMEVVEHVDALDDFMALSARRLRPGGLMFVSTINRTLYSLLTAKLAAEYVLRWLPAGTHEWSRFVTPAETTSLLASNGLHVVEQTGVSVNPLTRRMGTTRFLGGNYMLVAQKR